MGVLAAGIAHDFNNYLGGLLGYIELADKHLKLENYQKAGNYLSKVLDVSDRAAYLTHQLLTFSKGGVPIREKAEVKEMIEKSVQFALSGSSVSAVIKIEKDLKKCFCDKKQISQCIDNLVINSVQAMPEGGDLTVEAYNAESVPEELKGKSCIAVRVTDSGKGIPPEHISRVFDPFFSTKENGHGLGLATLYSIIHKHDGAVKVDSVYGQGSSFTLFLPSVD